MGQESIRMSLDKFPEDRKTEKEKSFTLVMVDSKEWRDTFLRRAQAKGSGEADFVPILLDLQRSLQAPHERLKKTAKWEKFREICTLRRDVLTL